MNPLFESTRREWRLRRIHGVECQRCCAYWFNDEIALWPEWLEPWTPVVRCPTCLSSSERSRLWRELQVFRSEHAPSICKVCPEITVADWRSIRAAAVEGVNNGWPFERFKVPLVSEAVGAYGTLRSTTEIAVRCAELRLVQWGHPSDRRGLPFRSRQAVLMTQPIAWLVAWEGFDGPPPPVQEWLRANAPNEGKST